MQYELFPRNDFSHKCININSVIRIFFYAYQHFLVMLLDCAVLALHTACKNSLSSYQMMGSRNSRLFKLGRTAAETGDPLMASRWEARTSPGTAEASLPARRPPSCCIRALSSTGEEITFPMGIAADVVLALHLCHLLSPVSAPGWAAPR